MLFILLWLFPVGASWLVAASGVLFSLVGQQWQNKNLEIVGISIAISIIIANLSVIILISLFRNSRVDESKDDILNITSAQFFTLFVLAVISGYGLFLSFGSTLFESAYGGAKRV